jgi:hypothetical protein
MNIAAWLKIGIMILISLTVQEIEVSDTSISAVVLADTLITEEMKELIDHGVKIEFELYNSLILKGAGKETFLKKRIVRSVSYDYYDEQYVLELQKNGTQREQRFISFNELDRAASDFGRIIFVINDKDYTEYSWFSQLSLLPNKMIEDELGQKTEKLWGNYSPSITIESRR